MEVLIGVLALFFVLFVAFGVFLGVRAVRALRRGVEQTGAQVRRTVEESALRTRSARPGPIGELARSRLELRSSVDSARRELESGVAHDPSLQEALGLLNRLHDHTRRLDGELRLLMEREPDKSRIAERMPELRERVAYIKESADSLRFAAQDRARQHNAEGLTGLREQIEIETGALRHWQGDEPAPGAPPERAVEQGEQGRSATGRGAALRKGSPRSAS